MTYTATTQRSAGSFNAGQPAGTALGRNVVLLGLTSLVTDISSEMVTSVLPLYLVFHLQLSPLALGAVDGMQQGGAALARIASGVLTDRSRHHRVIAAFGYALSALSKLLLLGVGANAGGLLWATLVDRVGKGVRTSPRDALISLAAPPERLATAFGVHRAFDTAGAMLGPVVAFLLLRGLPEAYDVVFVVSFGSALIGIAIVACLVRGVRDNSETRQRALSLRELFAPLVLSRTYRSLAILAGALGLFTLSDNFVYLALQRGLGFSATWLPLLFVATPFTYLVFSLPLSRVADRLGRGRVVILGYGALLLVYTLLIAAPVLPRQPIPLLALSILLLGVYYAATDGVLMAVVSSLLGTEQRATGIAVVSTALGLGKLCAGLGFGLLWSTLPLAHALLVFALGLLLTLLFSSRILWRMVPNAVPSEQRS